MTRPNPDETHSVTVSFRSTRKNPSAKKVAMIVALLKRIGFQQESIAIERQQLLSRKDVEAARKFYIQTSELSPARRMSPQTLKRLIREVRMTTIQFSHSESMARAQIQFVGGNWFPSLVMEHWERQRTRLPAGFVTVRSASTDLNEQLRTKLLVKCRDKRRAQ